MMEGREWDREQLWNCFRASYIYVQRARYRCIEMETNGAVPFYKWIWTADRITVTFSFTLRGAHYGGTWKICIVVLIFYLHWYVHSGFPTSPSICTTQQLGERYFCYKWQYRSIRSYKRPFSDKFRAKSSILCLPLLSPSRAPPLRLFNLMLMITK